MKIKTNIEDNHIIYSTSLITIQEDDEDRIIFLDSNGEFIDYLSNENLDWSYEDIVNQFKDKDNFQIVEILKSMFDSIYDSVYIEDNKRLGKLYYIYGQEFINRVGQYALIITE